MNNKGIDKNSREYLEKKVASARHSLLLVLIFTVINLVMLLVDSNSYFLFSASVPYYLTAFGLGMDMGMGTSGIGVFTTTALVISVVILVMYLVCWLLTKKRPAWYVVAAVLFALDTVVLVLVALGFDAIADSVMDFVFHAWVIIELFQAVSANKKLKNLPPEPIVDEAAEAVPVWQPAPVPEEPWTQPDKE
jgi:hypothetical protein